MRIHSKIVSNSNTIGFQVDCQDELEVQKNREYILSRVWSLLEVGELGPNPAEQRVLTQLKGWLTRASKEHYGYDRDWMHSYVVSNFNTGQTIVIYTFVR